MSDAGEKGEKYEASDGRTYTYIEKCGRFTEHGLWPRLRPQHYNPHSIVVSGFVDSDGRKKIPVGPDVQFVGGRHHPRVIVAKHGMNRYLCLTCGTWICDECGHKRLYANRNYTGRMHCAKKLCWSHKGTWRVGYHTLDRWWDHNPDEGFILGSSLTVRRVEYET